MTENKRFWILNTLTEYSGIKDKDKLLTFNEVVDLLNELHDENDQLRKENDMFSCELSVSANKEISRNCRIAELEEENKQLKFENNELKCALALNEVDYIIADGKKIDIPPYYEFEQRYDHVIHRREYDGYD